MSNGSNLYAIMRFAQRFLFLWGIIATICFAIAAAMTWMVVQVYAPGAPKQIAIYGDYRLKNGVGTIEYYGAPRPVWIVTFPAGSRFVVLPGDPNAACEDLRETFKFGPLGVLHAAERGIEPRLRPSIMHRYYDSSHAFDVMQINVTNLQSDRIGGRIACFINVPPTRESLTNSSFGFDYMLLLDLGAQAEAKAIRVSVNIPDAEQMNVYGGTSASSGGTDLTPGTEAIFRYVNMEQEGTRDVLFVLIGTFIALGAATTLEAIRPYIEMLAKGA